MNNKVESYDVYHAVYVRGTFEALFKKFGRPSPPVTYLSIGHVLPDRCRC